MPHPRLLLTLLLLLTAPALADDAPKKIVLIAGKKSHGPVGNGIHDYPWSVKLLKVMLDNSNVAGRVRVEYHLDGWPEDARALDDADTIMVVSDGRDGDLYEEAPHFQSQEKRDLIAKQIARGCGFATFHFSTFAPDEYADDILAWSGGYFDWETDGKREWYSAIQTAETEVRVATPEHAVARGLKPFTMQEEFYFNIRFRPEDKALTPIWTVPALPGREPDGRVVAWAREREDGGRGFGTTCGHFYENWRHEEFRRMILNALVWTAGADVPEGGVTAPFYTHEEITKALTGIKGAERAVAEGRPIKALILTGEQHPAHKWKDTTPALKDVLEQDPRMKVDVSEEIEDLATEKIAGYDLLVLNYCNWMKPGLSDAAEANFVKYLDGGGGLCLIHFANGAFHFSLPGARDSDWPEYRKICRRVWDHTPGKSGHDAYGKFAVEIEAKDHPITQGMEPFETTDELYYRQQGDEPITVLATARSKDTGRFEPMAFVHEYGKGRVFQTVLGHAPESIRGDGAAELIRRGAAWAAGQEPVPPGKAGEEDRRAGFRPAPRAAGRGGLETRPTEPKRDKITGHWGEDAVGFRWTEQDSVDNRWNRTDVGPFLASIVPLPGQPPVGKGLSLRIDDRREVSVCYDTASMTLRAAWGGGLLTFDPARFGLINSPRIDGNLLFASRPLPGWGNNAVQYGGMHLHDDRFVLSYTVGGTEVRESPSVEAHDSQLAVARTLEIGPSKQPLTIPVFTSTGPAAKELRGGVSCVAADHDKGFAAVAAVGDVGINPEVRDTSNVLLTVPPADTTRRVKLLVWRGTSDTLDRFAALVKASPAPEDLKPLMQPGAPRWTEPIKTRGVLGEGDGPYALDTLTLPFDNPYRALMFLGGHDFFANGDVALCTVHGDVWRVSGVDDTLERLTWKRYATGLFQPLGLRVIGDKVHVLGRDQITRLHDLNDDGVADFYECHSNRHVTSPGGHDYVACLETDAAGDFYFVHATQGLVRVSKDGSRLDVVATGFRNPNGMGLGPGDVLTVAPQEGEWTPASAVFEVRPGGHYGYGGPRVTPERPLGYDLPLCWIPRLRDNSSGGQVWVGGDRWGPLAGQLLHLSYGKCRMMLVLRETVDGQVQGGTVEFPLDFDSGICRGRFSPRDGQLYVGGLRGWVSAAVNDGCLQRVRYTGRPVDLPASVRTMENGLAITFTRPLDRDAAEQPDNYHIQQWNYRYGKEYGSPEYRVSDPRQEGRDEVEVRSATLLDDGRTVFLEIDDLRPVMQMAIGYSINAEDGTPLKQTIAYTIHHVGPDRMDPARLTRRHSPGQLAEADEAHLRHGLVLRFKQEDRVDVRPARLAAFHVPADAPPTSFLDPGPFTASVEGYLRVPLKGEYEFSLEGKGVAVLSINGQPVLFAEDDLATADPFRVRLHKGYNRLHLSYGSPHEGGAAVRLMWDAEDFPREPVPPTALWCDGRAEGLIAGERLRRGAELFTARRCVGCHAVPEGSGEAADAPDLRDAGARLDADWMYHWLLDPRRLRNDVTMPRLFDAQDVQSRQDAADLAAWLGGHEGGEETRAAASAARNVEDGRALYADLGCISCHRLSSPDAQDEHGRTSLAFVGAKYRPGALAAFLRAPHARYAWSRMPDFHLSETEAAALAAYLRSAATGRLSAAPELGTADPRRGPELYRSRGCANCHPRGNEPRIDLAVRPSAFHAAPHGGCLAADVPSHRNVPDFSFDDTERDALAAFLTTDGTSLSCRVPAEESRRLVESLRCHACHNIDDRQSPRGLILVEETDAGRVPDALPSLTWAGGKLHADWTERFLRGEVSYKPRPWLAARMPSFPAYAAALAAGLAAEHGNAASRVEAPVIDPELAHVGRQLSLKDTGLDCQQCHGAGRELPVGDDNTQLARGINFAHARERLRHDFYRRFVLDPPRYDVGTKMPKLAADGRTTKIRQHFDGDAERQFEALWHYIQSVEAPR